MLYEYRSMVLYARVGTHIHVMFTLHWRADPTVFGPVELSFTHVPDELIKIKRRKYPSESKPSGLATRLTHGLPRSWSAAPVMFLDDKSWIAGNVFRQCWPISARPGVVNDHRPEAGSQFLLFSLVI